MFERTNIRSVGPDDVGGPFDLLVTDVSFISLTLVMERLAAMLDEHGELIALIKPQFEVGKSHVGKKGVVRDPLLHVKAIEDVTAAVRSCGLVVAGLDYSPITGPEGNVEFLLHAVRCGDESFVDTADVVAAAHRILGA